MSLLRAPRAARTGQNARGPAKGEAGAEASGGETHLRGLGLGAGCFPSSCCRRPCGRSGPLGPAFCGGPAARSLAPGICARRVSGRSHFLSRGRSRPYDRHFRFLHRAPRSLGRCNSQLCRHWLRWQPLTPRKGRRLEPACAMGRAAGDAAAERSRGRPGGGLSLPVLGESLAGTARWGWPGGWGGSDRESPGLPVSRGPRLQPAPPAGRAALVAACPCCPR